MKVNVNVVKTKNNATLPTQGSSYSAGYDLYACLDEPIHIAPHTTAKIGTGLKFDLPEGTFGAIVARSGLATKQGLAPANKIGICDSDYRGEYIVALHNHSDEERIVQPNDRIAQLIIMPYIAADFIECDELSETERGVGGFGSTGK